MKRYLLILSALLAFNANSEVVGTGRSVNSSGVTITTERCSYDSGHMRDMRWARAYKTSRHAVVEGCAKYNNDIITIEWYHADDTVKYRRYFNNEFTWQPGWGR